MNVNLRGRVQRILDVMVREGYANTKSEAIRLAIINFGDEHMTEEFLVKKKLDRIDKEIEHGKRKVLNSKEALGEYSRHLE